MVLGRRFDPDAKALFLRFTTDPTDARKVLINNLIVALKDAGVWQRLDLLHIRAAADAQAASQNWVSVQSSTLVNSPSFTIDRGFIGNGSTSYLNETVTYSTLSKFTQNDASQGFWSLTDDASSGRDLGAVGNDANLVVGRSGTTLTARLNSITSASVTMANSLGFYGVRRNNSLTVDLFKNGSIVLSSASSVSGVPAASAVSVLRANASYSVRQCAVSFVGGYLNDAQITAFYTAVLTYLQAVGAA
jgi:hypothetical protein